MLTTLLCVAWLVGCTDVPSTGPPTPEFNSEFRFLNAAGDLADVSIVFDTGPAVNGLGFGTANTHQTYPSGNRVATLSSGDTLRVAMTSDQRATVMLMDKTGATREFIKLIERRIFDPATTSAALFRGVHASPDAGDIEFTVTGADTVSGTASFKDVSPYLSVTAGDYTLTVTTASGDTLTTSLSLSNMRHTGVLVGSSAAGTLALVGLDDN
ncbi:MAG: DUF4397 domain-containing protein [bacterium]